MKITHKNTNTYGSPEISEIEEYLDAAPTKWVLLKKLRPKNKRYYRDKRKR